MERFAAWVLDEVPYLTAAGLFFVENLLIFLGAIVCGELLVRRYRSRRIASPPPPLERLELAYAASTVVLNTVITLAGLWLYRLGVIRFRHDMGFGALVDVVVILLVMDVAMYVLHRIAHIEPLFRWIHAPHHRYDRPRPLTLFVLSPPEALAFGSLWLVVLMVYPASWLGMSIYLALNVVFGTVGHLGVEPFGRGWGRTPVVREVATSTFHAQHHLEQSSNYGFYTVLWDRLFGTLSPRYERDLGVPPAFVASEAEGVKE